MCLRIRPGLGHDRLHDSGLFRFFRNDIDDLLLFPDGDAKESSLHFCAGPSCRYDRAASCARAPRGIHDDVHVALVRDRYDQCIGILAHFFHLFLLDFLSAHKILHT